MRAVLIPAAAVASAVLLAGCGAQHDHRAASTATTPNLLALRPSEMERAWFKNLRLTQSTAAATGAHADKVAAAVMKAASVSGVTAVSANVYSTPALTSSLATALIVQVARPAYFLRHQLEPIIPTLAAPGNHRAYYLRVIDVRGKTVLEWSGRPSNGRAFFHGSLYVRPGLELCSPISASWINYPPPCPSK